MSRIDPDQTESLQEPIDDHPIQLQPEQLTSRKRDLSRWLRASGVFLFLLLIWFFATGEMPTEGEHLGIWSLVPAITTLVLVFLTREVISSLLIGVVVAGLVTGQLNIINSFLIPAIGTPGYATILIVYLWALGGLIGLWTRTGGARAFAEWAREKIVRGPRSASFFGWFMSMIFHQGGTISTILTGTTVRPVTDANNVSHEELTYIVDSTASPVAAVIPFNAWPLYVGTLVVGTTPLFMTEADAIQFFFRSIPFNFYGIFAVFSTLLFSLGLLPWTGKRMAAAIRRSRETGELDAPGAKPLTSQELTSIQIPDDYRSGVIDFVLPMGTLLTIAIVPYFVVGRVMIAEAFGMAVLVAFLLALAKGMTITKAMDGFVDGCKGVTIGAIILGLAVALGYASGELGTANYIVETTAGLIVPTFLPAILMVICMVVAFSIGTSWGTYAVVFPIAMPLAYAINPDPMYISLCFGAVLGGAVFGDQCSPISDTTILSALACGGDLMDHVMTQLPLALMVATFAAAASTIVAFML